MWDWKVVDIIVIFPLKSAFVGCAVEIVEAKC